nr:MAG TPA: hypothetical protein [Caudoviricetes sp.]
MCKYPIGIYDLLCHWVASKNRFFGTPFHCVRCIPPKITFNQA